MKPVCLIVMDGWGVSDTSSGNATLVADTPNLTKLSEKYPTTTLKNAGVSVGLPTGQMGNSEVGHLTMGAGRIVYQELSRINNAIEDSSFFDKELLLKTLSDIKNSGGALHLMGLVSDGGVHSSIDHLYALLEAAKKSEVERVYIHVFLDGRDTPPKSGAGYVRSLCEYLSENGTGEVATVSGRYYAMDRDKRWDRVKKAYDAITGAHGEGPRSETALSAVEEAYARGETDEFVVPTVVRDAPLSVGDTVIFFNFRADRARELARALTDPAFDGFEREKRPQLLSFVCMTEYDRTLSLPVIFPHMELTGILGEVLSRNAVRQFRVSETEKYAHVTFFFNGGVEEPFAGEERLLIPSIRDVATYDLAPEMRAAEIADAAAEKINEGGTSFILLNLANGDMVGHTGIMDAAVKACEAVDKAVAKVTAAAIENGWVCLITSDHGNAEMMYAEDGHSPQTAHTTNVVPFILVDDERKGVTLRESGGLMDIAPTVLKIMNIDIPEEMKGTPLFSEQ
ncbi:MAG: 2,3-bisphosphoglycerate-independent phosphoglycerate mutase [Thermodesulfobacteriota bacterium]